MRSSLMAGVGVAVLAAVLLTPRLADAWDCPCMGQGGGRFDGASAGALKKFQAETLSLRDALAAKQIDLGEEYDKAEPDAARIAALRKEIVDLETKIDASAEKHGLRGWARGQGRFAMSGWSGRGGCW